VTFGMTRREVRKALASPVTSFKRAKDDDAETDEFAKLGVFVEYDADDHAVSVEISEPGEPILESRNLLDMPFAQLKAWARKLDKALEVDESGFDSPKLGIGVYADIKPGDRTSHPESVIAFGKGYLDD